MPSASGRKAEIERARAEYTARDADSTTISAWSPLNPAAIMIAAQRDAALARLLTASGVTTLEGSCAADFGCGGGDLLAWFARLGLCAKSSFGVDLSESRIEAAHTRLPDVTLIIGSADDTSWPSDSFDFVAQMTLMSSVHDEQIRCSIAREMDRVLKPGGRVLWFDVRPSPLLLRAVFRVRRLAYWLARGVWRGELFAVVPDSLVRFDHRAVSELFPGYVIAGGPACVGQDVVRARGRGGALLSSACDLLPPLRSNLALLLTKPEDR